MAAGETKEAWIQELCLPAEQTNNLKLYQLKTEESLRDEEHKIQVLTIGPVNQDNFKSVLLLGETGAGKTRLIDAFINHIFDIDFDDPFRLYLKDQLVGDPKKATESQTDYITAYRIYHQDGMRYASNFLFIDTPGFCDTRGEDFQGVLLGRLNAFFLGKFEIDDLHCIGIVVKANINRIVKHEVDTLKELTAMLGDDCSPITRLLCTFACDRVSAASTVRDAGIEFESQHGFDNYPICSLLDPKPDVHEDCTFMKYRWNKMCTEYCNFFKILQESPSVNVQRTRDLHQKKKELAALEMLLVEDARHLTTLKKVLNDKIKTKESLEAKAKLIRWKETVHKEITSTLEVDDGHHVHNCKKCKKTCKTCEDPSNVSAGLIGAGSGIGTAVTTGAGASLASGAIIGSEVGLLGGPIGAVVGLGTGTIIGLTAGILSGIFSQKSKTDCPLATTQCSNCLHQPNDHKIVTGRIETNCSSEERINMTEKRKYDDLIQKTENLQLEIQQKQEALKNVERTASKNILELVNLCKDISDLSFGSNNNNPEKIIEKMYTFLEDPSSFEVFKWFKEEITKPLKENFSTRVGTL